MKFLKNFSIYRTNLTKYSPSMIRIVIGVLGMLFVWFRRSIYPIDAAPEWLQIVESVVIYLVTYGFFALVLIAVLEMFATYANRKKLKQKKLLVAKNCKMGYLLLLKILKNCVYQMILLK